MAKKVKLTATYNGQTFTRTTARTYTHVVLVRVTEECKASRIAQVKKDVAEDNTVWGRWYDNNPREGYTREEFIDMKAAEYLSQFNDDDWGVFAWCGRFDLAMKQQQKAINYGIYQVQTIAIDDNAIKSASEPRKVNTLDLPMPEAQIALF